MSSTTMTTSSDMDSAVPATTLYKIAQQYFYPPDVNKGLRYTLRTIKKILKNEDACTIFFRRDQPPMRDVPIELLGWRFGLYRFSCGFLSTTPPVALSEVSRNVEFEHTAGPGPRYSTLTTHFTSSVFFFSGDKATYAETKQLLTDFLPSSLKPEYVARFESDSRPRAQFLFKCLQINAAVTLGLLAWYEDGKMKTASDRFAEAVDLATATVPAFNPALRLRTGPGAEGSLKLTTSEHAGLTAAEGASGPAEGLEMWISDTLQQARLHLRILAGVAESKGDQCERDQAFSMVRDGLAKRGLLRSVMQVVAFKPAQGWKGLIHLERLLDGEGVCARCGVGERKLLRCSRCRVVACE